MDEKKITDDTGFGSVSEFEGPQPSKGKITVGFGTPEQREIEIANWVQASFKDNRLATVAEAENNEGFLLSVENPPSSGRYIQNKMWLSKESFVSLVTASMLYFQCKGEDFGALLQESLDSKDIHYRFSNGLMPIPSKEDLEKYTL